MFFLVIMFISNIHSKVSTAQFLRSELASALETIMGECAKYYTPTLYINLLRSSKIYRGNLHEEFSLQETDLKGNKGDVHKIPSLLILSPTLVPLEDGIKRFFERKTFYGKKDDIRDLYGSIFNQISDYENQGEIVVVNDFKLPLDNMQISGNDFNAMPQEYNTIKHSKIKI